MAIVFIDACDGSCYTEYFDDQAVFNVTHDGGSIQIKGNMRYFLLLAKQMIYFSCNDFMVPFGSHVHYDAFKHIGHHGLELILEVAPTQSHNVTLDAEEGLCVEVYVPQCVEELCAQCPAGAQVHTKYDGYSVHILGNARGLMYMATVLLFMVENNYNVSEFICSKHLLNDWHGDAIKFSLAGEAQKKS